MLCCVVLLSIVGIVFKRKQADDPFPPPARRGIDGTAAAYRPTARPIIHAATATAARATTFRWFAFGVVAYVAMVTALLGVGAGESIEGSGSRWFVRDLTFAILAGVAMSIAARGPAVCPVDRRLALVLIGAGTAWTVLGLIDMHVLMLFEIAGGWMLPDVVFHAVGVWSLVGGVYLLQRSKAGRVAASVDVCEVVRGKLTA